MQPNILKSKQATKAVILTLQNKNRSCTCREMLNPVPYFSKHSIQSYAALPVAVANACFEAPTALSLSLMLSVYHTNVEPIDQVKSNLS